MWVSGYTWGCQGTRGGVRVHVGGSGYTWGVRVHVGCQGTCGILGYFFRVLVAMYGGLWGVTWLCGYTV